MPHQYDNIPPALKSRPNWVTWGIRDAPLKAPFNVSDRIDGAVSTLVLEYLSRIKITAKSIALEKRYENEIAELKSQKKEAEKENKMCKDRLTQLLGEIAKSLNDESKFTPEMLAVSIDNTKFKIRMTSWHSLITRLPTVKAQ